VEQIDALQSVQILVSHLVDAHAQEGGHLKGSHSLLLNNWKQFGGTLWEQAI